MVRRVQAALYGLLRRRNLPDEELHRYVLMLAVALAAGAVHVAFSFFFFVVHTLPLAISHMAGIGVFLLTIALLNGRRYDLAGLVLSVMIMFSSLATIFAVGGSNFSVLHQFIVLLMQMVVPFSNRKVPIGFSIALPLIMVGSYLFALWHVPPYDIGRANEVLSVMNLVVASTGMIMLMSLERIVREFLQRFHQRKVQALEDQVYLDPLTALYNRRYAADYFARLPDGTQERNICVAIADIDDFKRINDTYGHDAGDAVLKQISDIFTRSTRKSDRVFRWGGEEFLLILQNITMEDAARTLDNIREKVFQHSFAYKDHVLHISVTIGMGPLDVANIARSIEACDRKLYEGKQSGKNMVLA